MINAFFWLMMAGIAIAIAYTIRSLDEVDRREEAFDRRRATRRTATSKPAEETAEQRLRRMLL